jgi:hypothetical protein
MHRFHSLSRTRLALTSILALSMLFSAGLLFVLVVPADAAATQVPLGGAGRFAVLAGSGITNTGPTTVHGDIGSYPTTSITGRSSMTIDGTDQAGDAVTQNAKNALTSAYNTAASEGPTSPIAANLGGRTLVAGVYNSGSSIGLTGTLTLNGAGNSNSVFVFQAGSTLTTASASRVILENGAQACNVFWQVTSSATLGTGSSFVGSILALQSITVTTGTTISGRVLARNGAVTLDSDTILRPSCKSSTHPTTTTTTTTTAHPTTTVASAKPGHHHHHHHHHGPPPGHSRPPSGSTPPGFTG